MLDKFLVLLSPAYWFQVLIDPKEECLTCSSLYFNSDVECMILKARPDFAMRFWPYQFSMTTNFNNIENWKSLLTTTFLKIDIVCDYGEP